MAEGLGDPIFQAKNFKVSLATDHSFVQPQLRTVGVQLGTLKGIMTIGGQGLFAEALKWGNLIGPGLSAGFFVGIPNLYRRAQQPD
jgi:hypothetical protein